jgi:ParB-like chromosome segregation protein Spo0J
MRLKDRIVHLSPIDIIPCHSEIYPKKTASITEDMLVRGWQGRPLLVMKLGSGKLKAMGGSHRIRAAVAAGLATIPVIQMTDEEVAALSGTIDWTSDAGPLGPLISENLFS